MGWRDDKKEKKKRKTRKEKNKKWLNKWKIIYIFESFFKIICEKREVIPLFH
jgi:hypothetical protein